MSSPRHLFPFGRRGKTLLYAMFAVYLQAHFVYSNRVKYHANSAFLNSSNSSTTQQPHKQSAISYLPTRDFQDLISSQTSDIVSKSTVNTIPQDLWLSTIKYSQWTTFEPSQDSAGASQDILLVHTEHHAHSDSKTDLETSRVPHKPGLTHSIRYTTEPERGFLESVYSFAGGNASEEGNKPMLGSSFVTPNAQSSNIRPQNTRSNTQTRLPTLNVTSTLPGGQHSFSTRVYPGISYLRGGMTVSSSTIGPSGLHVDRSGSGTASSADQTAVGGHPSAVEDISLGKPSDHINTPVPTPAITSEALDTHGSKEPARQTLKQQALTVGITFGTVGAGVLLGISMCLVARRYKRHSQRRVAMAYRKFAG